MSSSSDQPFRVPVSLACDMAHSYRTWSRLAVICDRFDKNRNLAYVRIHVAFTPLDTAGAVLVWPLRGARHEDPAVIRIAC